MPNATKADALEGLKNWAYGDAAKFGESRILNDIIAALEAERRERKAMFTTEEVRVAVEAAEAEIVANALRNTAAIHASYAERDAKILAQLIDAEKFLERDDNREGAIFAIARALAIFNAPGYDAIGGFNA